MNALEALELLDVELARRAHRFEGASRFRRIGAAVWLVDGPNPFRVIALRSELEALGLREDANLNGDEHG